MIALWEGTIYHLRTLPHASEPAGQDAARIRYVLFELYVLGERPSAEDIRVRGGANGRATRWSRNVARLWQERLNKPTRGIQGRRAWRRPFSVPQVVIEEHGLAPIADRLASQVEATGRSLAEAIERSDDGDEIARQEAQLAVTVAELRLYGQLVDPGP